MSKKHFIALADALRNVRPIDWESNCRLQWQKDVEAIASVCSQFNGEFRKDRWMDYIAGKCGPNGGKK